MKALESSQKSRKNCVKMRRPTKATRHVGEVALSLDLQTSVIVSDEADIAPPSWSSACNLSWKQRSMCWTCGNSNSKMDSATFTHIRLCLVFRDEHSSIYLQQFAVLHLIDFNVFVETTVMITDFLRRCSQHFIARSRFELGISSRLFEPAWVAFPSFFDPF